MAFIPVEMTNGASTVTAETADELVQLQFDGWVALGELPAPNPTPGSGAPDVTSLLTVLESYFVSRDQLRLQPTPPDPDVTKPGTVWINTSV